MDQIVAFGRFWWEFIIGDDWLIAAVVAVTLAILLVVNHAILWPVLPIVVIAILGFSLMRATQ